MAMSCVCSTFLRRYLRDGTREHVNFLSRHQFSAGAPIETPAILNMTNVTSVPRQQIVAMPREEEGSKLSAKLRKAGWIPAVLYGGHFLHDVSLIKVDAKELRKQLRISGESFENTIFDLVVGDKVHAVVPRQLSLHPATDRIMNVSFLRYKEGLEVNIPLRPINEDQSAAIRRGSFFLQVCRKLKVKAWSPDIPSQINVDLAGAVSKQVVRLENLTLPRGLEPVNKDPRFTIGSVIGKGA